MRTALLVDGFNLYHALQDASVDLGGAGTKWLDLTSLCRSFLGDIRGGAQLAGIDYFSALATFRESVDTGITERHRLYIECLRSRGVKIHMGTFKVKHSLCLHCGRENLRPEEKGSDVALGVRLQELFWTDACDAAVLVTGDNDLAPAVRTARAHFPWKPVLCYFPYKRFGFDLEAVASRCLRMRARRYLRHQFPDPVRLPDGVEIHRPSNW